MKSKENYLFENRRSIYKISENSGLKSSISPYIFISKTPFIEKCSSSIHTISKLPTRNPLIFARKKSHFRSFSLFSNYSPPKNFQKNKNGILIPPKNVKNQPQLLNKKIQVTPLVPTSLILSALREYSRSTLYYLSKEEYSFCEILKFLSEKGITLHESDFEMQKLIKTFLETSRRQAVFDEIVRVFDEGGINMKEHLEKAFAVAIGKEMRERTSSSSSLKNECDHIEESSIQDDSHIYDDLNDDSSKGESSQKKDLITVAQKRDFMTENFKWNLEYIKEVDYARHDFRKDVDFYFADIDFEIDRKSEKDSAIKKTTFQELK